MEFIEADSLPVQCQKCAELGYEEYNCEECDYLGLRFQLSEEDQHRLDGITAEKQRLWRLRWKQKGFECRAYIQRVRPLCFSLFLLFPKLHFWRILGSNAKPRS